MSSRHLSRAMFHGTDHPFREGDIIKPHGGSKVAWATELPDYAHYMAGDAAGLNLSGWSEEIHQASRKREGQQSLFGMHYEVEPVDPGEIQKSPSYQGDLAWTSEKGFRVKKFKGFSV